MQDSNRSETVRLTTAQAIVKFLQVQYSERDGGRRRLIPAMFGIFGHGNVHAMGQALYEYGHDLSYYRPCNEQAMVHTAAGFAKANLRLATLACTSSIGPGATNMVTGAAAATINRLPVLLLPSDYYATRHQGPVLQELEHPVSADVSVNDCFRPVSRFFDRISRPEQLLTALPEAMRILTDPVETGAVTLSLPQDVQAQAYDFPAHFFDERVWRVERPAPDQDRIAEAVAMLENAKRPMIIAGGGVPYSEAWDELREFSEGFGIPVGETFAGHGAMRNGSEMALGGHGTAGTDPATIIAERADLVIAVGARLTDIATGSHSSFQHPDVRFVHVNVAGHDAYKLGALPIIADARQALIALAEAAGAAGIGPNPAYVEEIATAKRAWGRRIEDEVYVQVAGEAMSQAQVVGVLNEESKAGDTVINDAGTLPGDLHKLWDVSNGATCHLEFGYSTMGYALPASLGVRMAQPSGEVYAFIGDATYLMNPTELVTAMAESLKITVVISENHGLQAIRGLQMDVAGRSFGNELRSRNEETDRLEGDYLEIDFARNAESLGARAWNVTTPDELRAALREARDENRSCVIVAETEKHRYGPESGAWWDLAVAEATADPVTRELRAEYEAQQQLQRFYH
ncbi:MAG: 3D-(3,5/4)-trihydroxycyclohexane-1,2-dione acylhydrolase (decyclizing) [SAR202 cluster bacterium]|jgi:3D-(3,5/4)-trihydroxycyclohexane-1,2-dione acylhydrolase (decyclizing)|nr:3D-(3,5/4)-trihydroxycyclohexane-1,2-dione acylhydrolase (decyclizing) [Chloroflexota bacterium]MDP6664175.1 3D-(3,5/4)-trihydroxycyclohexane-1,2-dione acylhydrolase (decyclizing) [SAR202 cluster bacterium]MQG58484.1 3D-(3,5/4)-trihydroxycyclohexane-1,2-dione acylhydrolase (decyclizing) [SAR202 cluster bacterium]MQG68883.1 3D-(3,5/4)-trihydroxycyclohexane-1,2-dione acylhydrolase (decyclizing) [SAR202 cluster bacterium]HAL49677.1 3D-(3,5/4)-trihydroxycyclohexane-1,2-dione acylhydrolase (decyc|tara:strand:- start:249 stop:2141 length:1893 start_codon:yes stop_codon:yes gene_type:complete